MKNLAVLLKVVIFGFFLMNLTISSFGDGVSVFGPKTYTMGTGKPQVFSDTFSVPAGSTSFNLIVKNGAQGKNRVSSALLWINGTQVVGPSDFNQNINVITKKISLKKGINQIKVELRSNPGSFIVVNIAGEKDNRPPVSKAGPDQAVFAGNKVTLDGSKSSDSDGDPLTFHWSFFSVPEGSTAALSDSTAVRPTFVMDKPGTYVVQLIVNDGTVDSLPDTVMITTHNNRPVAKAGPDQAVFAGNTVTLDGSKSSDVDGDPLTFHWSFFSVPEGSTAILSDSTAVRPTFVVDKPGTYVLQLMVNDGMVDSLPDTVVITTHNSRPLAKAGPDQTVSVRDKVTLDGKESFDVDGDPLTFFWSFTSRPAGSTMMLSDSKAVQPTFVVDKPGTYVLQLMVNDGMVDSLPDTVAVTTHNSRPVAKAGPDQTVSVGDQVILDGKKSYDVDGDSLTFFWSFTSSPPGSTAALSDPFAVRPTFVVDKPGTYVLQLMVNDGTVDSLPDTVMITTHNSRPLAKAGLDQTVSVGDQVTLDGSGSHDADGDPLVFYWSFTARPAGSTATLSDPFAVQPTFVVDKPGAYVFQLIVNDGKIDSCPDTVVITTHNSRPLANAGPDQTVSVGDKVTLDGSGSQDADGDPLTFCWSFTARPNGSNARLSNPRAVKPTFVVDKPGTYVLQLIVNDGKLQSKPDTSLITTTGNSAPVVQAGTDQTITLPANADLAGTVTDDGLPQGGSLTITWSKFSGPGTVTFGNPTAVVTSAGFSAAGTYVLRLTASDSQLSASDDVQITVNALPDRPPTITSTPVTSATAEQLYVYDVEATDPDAGDLLTFSLDAFPADMTINASTGLIQWTPSAAQLGGHNVTVRVRDIAGLFALQNFTVQVNSPAIGTPFFTSAPPTTAVVGQLYSYDADASDPEGGALVFSLDQAPNGLTIDPSTGLIQWTPTLNQLDGNSVVVRVSDVSGLFAVQAFVVQVSPVPTLPPVITSTPVTSGAVGKPYTYPVTATDPDPGDTITYSLNGAPLGMTIDPAGGAISWLPVITQTGPQNVSVIASDGKGGTAAQTFSINVSTAQANRPPLAQDDQYAVRRGETLTVPAPGVLQNDTDPDGQNLTSLLVTGPTKGTFNFAADGSFNYTPAVPPANSTEPQLKFSYSDVNTSIVATIPQPVVIDLDKDGLPEIVFISQGPFGTCKLIAVHGNNGSVAFSVNAFQPAATPPIVLCDPYAELAAGDIDGDGFPEIIAVDGSDGSGGTDTFRRQLIAFNHDGTYKWTSEDILSKDVSGGLGRITSTGGFRKPVIADLDGDGFPEIVVGYSARVASSPGVNNEDFVTAFNNQGRILWTVRGSGSSDGLSPANGTVIVQDIDLDGFPEILYSDDVFDHQGNLIRSAAACPTCEPQVRDIAVANLDDDPFAEIIYLDRFGKIWVYDHTGAIKWGPLALPNTTPSFLTVGDVDGDGKAEIVVTVATNIIVIAGDGSSTRSIPVPFSLIFNSANTTIFDLNGDGKPELIHHGSYGPFDTASVKGAVFIFDGPTGALLHSIQASRNGGVEDQGPVVADVNGDGSAEIITGGWNERALLHVFEGKNGPWAKARPIYNQVNYNVTNVNSDGTIPAHPAINWLTPGLNNFRVNIPLPEERTGDKDQFTYRANDGSLDSNTATARIDILPPNHAPQILSQPPTVASNNIEYLYAVLAFDADVGEVLTFSLPQAPAGMTINPSSGLVRWTPTGSQIGRHTVALKVTDSQGQFAYQGYAIDVVGAVTVPPVVGQTQAAAQTILTGAGLTVGTIFTSASSTLPAGQVISQGIAAGTQVPAGSPVSLVISSGAQTATVPNVVGQSQASAQSAISGKGLNLGSVATAPSTTVAFGNIISQDPAGGTPVPLDTRVNLIVSLGTINLTGLTSIVVEPSAATILVGEEQSYKATGVFNDGTSQNLTGIVGWSSTTPAAATISSVGLAQGLADGTTTIQASANSISGSAALTVRAPVGDNTLPNAAIVQPANNSEVTSPVDVVGNATDANFLKYRLEYAAAGEDAFTLLTEGTSPVTNGLLGRFDPTLLINDQYTLRLTVFDRGGNTSQASVTVQVARDRKVGLFSITFQDFNLAMSGLPITVNRTYDSRDKRKGDFGFGWQLDVQTLRIRTNRVLGTGWVRSQSGAVINLSPIDAHKVSVTLPDGRIEEFDMQVSPAAGLGSLDFTNVIGFSPRAGTLGRLDALANNSLAILNAGLLDELVDINTLNTYNPQLYRYATAEGTQIEIHVTEGVKKVTDLNGNTLTFGPNGIIHSAGKSVTFTRDAEGRVARITDPSGNVRTYAYDINGDLINATDQVGNLAQYRYNRSHGLIDILDPAGNHALRNEYDAQGRLTATVDAQGNRTEFTHDLNTQQEIVRDRLGNITVSEYDAVGNIVAKTDALGHRTTYTYDGQGNPLTQTDPLGRAASKTYDAQRNVLTSKDFDGNTTTNTYNARKQLLTTTDPEGRLTTNVYDTGGNLTQKTDPESGITRHTYDSAGNRLTTTDPLGNVTTFTYDSFGHKVSETDPVGTRTTFIRDANGNLLSTTRAGTQSTYLQYDGAGRLTKTMDALGHQILVTFSAVRDGKQPESVVDAKGQVTRFDYDGRGNLVSKTFPDGSTETNSFDAESRLLSKTDRDGHTTAFQYDALGQQTRVTNADGSSRTKAYDAAGRVLSQTDERGNTTTYAYPSNRQTVTDALTNVTVHELDSRQRRLRMTDALSRVTTFAYDSAGNLIRTTFPDGTTKNTVYDAAKRKITETDQAGKVTQFGYDAGGRLLRLTNAAGGVTTYTYDDLGNQLTQTDANGHTTLLEYNLIGQLTKRTRPLGQFEIFAYDANGNQISHTDFTGQTTTFDYDTNNRRIRKNLPGGVVVPYAYTPIGLRTQAGGDTYSYDTRGRLTQELKASGEVLSYTYDAAGNKTSLVTPQGTTTYTYDALNRLAGVVDTTGTTTYSYDAVGNLTSTIYPNGLTTAYTYNTLNRLTQVSNTGPGGLISSYTYSLGAAGNRLQVTEAGSGTTGRSVIYSYDLLYRLTQEQIDEPGTGNDQTIAYVYDAVGNRTQMNRNGVVTTYTYDANDRLFTEASTGGTFTSTYDNSGNLKSRRNGALTDSFTYDAENRLISADVQNGANPGPVAYAYDADGMRTGKTANGITTSFLLDKNQTLAQVVTETAGSTVVIYGYGHHLISQTRPGTGTRFYQHDGQSSTRQLTDTTGTVTDTYTFDAFGVLLSSNGSTPNIYLYAGEQLDSNLGFYYLRARYYQQTTGRFVTADPFPGFLSDPGSLHRYLYAHANPVNNRDPSGMLDIAELMVDMFIRGTLIGIATSGISATVVFASGGTTDDVLDAALKGFVFGFAVGSFSALGQTVFLQNAVRYYLAKTISIEAGFYLNSLFGLGASGGLGILIGNLVGYYIGGFLGIQIADWVGKLAVLGSGEKEQQRREDLLQFVRRERNKPNFDRFLATYRRNLEFTIEETKNPEYPPVAHENAINALQEFEWAVGAADVEP
jgi:RHS repeat-associated protein